MRVALLCLLVAIGFGLYYIGLEHQVLMDNEATTIDGVEYPAIAYATVAIDGEEKKYEYFADDRDVIKMAGPRHSIELSVYAEDEETLIKTVKRDVDLKTTPVLMISIPALAADAKNIFLAPPTQGGDGSSSGGDESAPGEEAPTQ